MTSAYNLVQFEREM